MKFAELPLPDVFRGSLDDRGYTDATPVQALILDEAGNGRDLLVSSRTGSGKTVAFGIAMSPAIIGDDGRSHVPRTSRALVVAPTRELALQVARELTWLYRKTGARVTTCVGGMDFSREARALRDGADIVVGTPGRLCDHLNRETMSLAKIDVVVLDEADEMLDMGFREELETLLKAAPTTRRTLLFSATLPKDIVRMAQKFTKDPMRIEATSQAEGHVDITTIGHLVAPRERENAVVNILRFHDAASALVFCATRDGVARLTASLVERGFAAVGLSGEMSQSERTRAVQAIRDGRARVLVGTDVAARGLDLPNIALVVHGDLPHDPQVLQHRSGRTGRAGRRGTAVLLAPFMARRRAESMLRAARIAGSWTPVPSAEEVYELDKERSLLMVGALTTELDEDDLAEGRILIERFGAEAIAGALLRRARRSFPQPEELPMTLGTRFDRGPRKDESRARALETPAPAPVTAPVTPPARQPTPVAAPAIVEERAVSEPAAEKPVPYRGPEPVAARPERKTKPAPDPFAHDDNDEVASTLSPPRHGRAEGIWFHVNVGRNKQADPRWLLPLICRRGDVTKRDIGRIEIEERETFFEINPARAEAFSNNCQKPDKLDPNVKIAPAVPRPASRRDQRAERAPPPAARPAPKKRTGPPSPSPSKKPTTGGSAPPKRKVSVTAKPKKPKKPKPAK